MVGHSVSQSVSQSVCIFIHLFICLIFLSVWPVKCVHLLCMKLMNDMSNWSHTLAKWPIKMLSCVHVSVSTVGAFDFSNFLSENIKSHKLQCYTVHVFLEVWFHLQSMLKFSKNVNIGLFLNLDSQNVCSLRTKMIKQICVLSPIRHFVTLRHHKICLMWARTMFLSITQNCDTRFLFKHTKCFWYCVWNKMIMLIYVSCIWLSFQWLWECFKYA